MMIKKISFLFFTLFFAFILSHSLYAQSFSTQFFKPSIDASDYFGVSSSQTLREGNYYLGFWLDYAKSPYEIGNTSFDKITGVVPNTLVANVVGSYAFSDWLTVGGRLPAYLLNNIDSTDLGRLNEINLNLGDLELAAKFRILDRKKHSVGISILPFLTLPTATHPQRDFSGNDGVAGGGKLVIDTKIKKRLSLALNAGYEFRPGLIDIGGNTIDDYLLLGFGAAYDVIPKKLKLVAETQVESLAKDLFKRRTTPAEARLGIKYSFNKHLTLNAGGGLGYTNGIRSPEFRVLTGLTYSRRPIDDVDLDNKKPTTTTLVDKEPDVFVLGDEIILKDKIFFDYDKAQIREITKPILDKLAKFILDHPEFKKIRLEGHTDDLGSAAYNQKLSEKRANSVLNYLVTQGVERGRLKAVGYGKTKPAVPNTDEINREKNRRVQIFVEDKD